jgi:carbonic anhydrase
MPKGPLHSLLQSNRQWAAARTEADPDFFARLTRQQAPEYLWIGCADSRVPANEIVDLAPGELFVHRNVANIVGHTDLNCLSVLQYAVEVLKVRHIIVCGHYGCGGVIAALRNQKLGLINNWLRHVQDVAAKHTEGLSAITDERLKEDRLCELNVIEQVANVCQTTIMESAWSRGQDVTVHGWIYRLSDGIIKDLKVSSSDDDISHQHQAAKQLLAGSFLRSGRTMLKITLDASSAPWSDKRLSSIKCPWDGGVWPFSAGGPVGKHAVGVTFLCTSA